MDLTSAEIAALRREAHDLDPILNIGKSGLSAAVVDEVKTQLKRRKLVKLKLLKAALESGDRKALGAELAERAGAVLVEVRGNTVVLWKGKRRRRATAEPDVRGGEATRSP